MPELPELVIYAERLTDRLKGRSAISVRSFHPFVLRTMTPVLTDFAGRRFLEAERVGKQLLLNFENDWALGFHLMLAGRLLFRETPTFRPHRTRTLFAVDFEGGLTLEMTEEGTKRRASVRAFDSAAARDAFRAEASPGLDPMGPQFEAGEYGRRLRAQNHQLKTALRERSILSGVGNAYADEILFEARLAPTKLTSSLSDADIERLTTATRDILGRWIDRIRDSSREELPTKQREWRSTMNVHGKTNEPCPVCSTLIARISFKDSETNYCPTCQNEGRLLADRRLSRLKIPRKPPERPRGK